MDGLLDDPRDGVGADEGECEEKGVDPATPYREQHDHEESQAPVVEAWAECGDGGQYGRGKRCTVRHHPRKRRTVPQRQATALPHADEEHGGDDHAQRQNPRGCDHWRSPWAYGRLSRLVGRRHEHPSVRFELPLHPETRKPPTSGQGPKSLVGGTGIEPAPPLARRFWVTPL